MMMRRQPVARILLAIALCVVFATSSGFTEPQRRARRPPEERILPQGGLDAAGPDVADPAPALTLVDTDGKKVKLSDLWGKGALLLVLGSATSPEFRATAPSLQQLAERRQPHVQVVLVYTREAQPANGQSPYEDLPLVPAGEFARPEANTLTERRAAARLAAEKLKLGTPVRVLVDGMDNGAWSAYGPAPNNAFAIDRHGSVVGRQTWFEAEAMDSILLHLLARNESAPKPKPATAGEAGAETGEGGRR
jgi:hypothetical protein